SASRRRDDERGKSLAAGGSASGQESCVGSSPSFVVLVVRSHPDGDVALRVEHSPDVDVVVALDVEHQIGIPLHPAASQPRERELVRVAGRPSGGMLGDAPEGRLQGFDKTQCHVASGFAHVVVYGRLDVPTGQRARTYWLATQRVLRVRSLRLAK